MDTSPNNVSFSTLEECLSTFTNTMKAMPGFDKFDGETKQVVVSMLSHMIMSNEMEPTIRKTCEKAIDMALVYMVNVKGKDVNI